MNFRNRRLQLQALRTLALVSLGGVAWTAHFVMAQAADAPPVALETSFEHQAQPFLRQNCFQCHNSETAISGVRVDQLNSAFEERHIRLWEAVRRKVSDGTMPPEGLPQPTDVEREQMVAWITEALDFVRSRPTPKNGIVRRLTKSQYRNTLRELLLLDDDLTDILPPDAVSKDGFVNNTATLELSPLLMEAYLEIAEEGLSRAIVSPDSKPSIQNFSVSLGKSVNPEPLPEKLILGAGSTLLENADYLVSQLTPSKPFAFDPFKMRTKYRFIEGYKGNGTVRGWRDFDSIYHAVFAGMRGSRGYPKGTAHDSVTEGLLLRPAIPNDELFGQDGTFGPKANFKISLRELPHDGRFRVTVTAAKYSDGLLLDPGDAARSVDVASVSTTGDPTSTQSVLIDKAGIYQVDVHELEREAASVADSSRLDEGLAGVWSLDDRQQGLEGDARLVDSPFGKAVALDGDDDSVVIPRSEGMNVGEGDFTVAAWIRPTQLRNAGIVVYGGYDQMPGWQLQMSRNKGSFRIVTTGFDEEDAEFVASPDRVIRVDTWQHVAAVVQRGGDRSRLYVNGIPVAKGEIGSANLDNPKANLHLGRISYNNHFRGELDEVRLYTRALDESELQALVEPGRAFVLPPPETPQDMLLTLGGRPFSGELKQPAWVALRLDAGPLEVQASNTGIRDLDRIAFTRLDETDEISQRFLAFERRTPRVGVHLGFRRDCGSTFAPVGKPQTVAGGELTRFTFEGAINNYPEPSVEKNNVNYLAGVREIAVRSEYTDGRDTPRLVVRSVEFEGPFYDTWPPKSHQSIFVDFDRKSDPQAYAREIIRGFATRAYRRPVRPAEEAALMAVFQRSLDDGGSFQQSVRDALQVTLTSPQFLFLVEASATPEAEPLDDYELASKLSYFLWNGPPDETTLSFASGGALREHLNSEVARMVKDERFNRFIDEFTSQWLSLDKFDVLEPDREQFSRLTRDARVHLRQEPVELLKYMIRNNAPVRDLVDSDYVVANEVVATYYDLGDKIESGFDFVRVAHGRPELGGVLTQAALMAGLSDGRESNPVKRGAWLARKIIAEPPDDPPPNVPDLKADTEGLTLRQRLEQHRSLPGCFQCHTKIDPWGVALEEIDAGGRLKLDPPDARSTLPDATEISGVNDLKRYLGHDRVDQVAFSVLKHLAIYANGRNLTYNELNFLKDDALQLRAGDYRMQDLIEYVVNSKLFLEK